MVCSSNSRREADILWRSLVGVTFLFCSFIVYRFIASGNVQCLSKSDCSKSLKHTAEKFQSENCNTVCTTKDCMDISNYMLRSMNQTADPCSDFYNFACGNFIDKYGIHDNYSAFNDGVGDELHKILKDFIETSDEPNGTLMHRIKIIYNSCVNTGSSEINVTHDILSFLGNVGLHNWPYLTSNFSFVNQELPELLGKLNSYNEDVFFRFKTNYFYSGFINGGYPVLMERLDPIKLRIIPVFEYQYRDLNKFEKILKKILRNLGLKPEEIKMMWKDLVTIDKRVNKLEEVYNLFESREEETIKCRNETEEYKIMICKTLNSVVRNGKLESRFDMNEIDVRKSVLYFMENVYGLIKSFSDRAIANHIALNVILNNLDHMNFFTRKSMKVEIHQSERELYTYTAYFEKWRYCVVWIAEKLSYALATEYVDKLFPNAAEDEVDYMTEEIINTAIKFLHNQEGIDELFKIKATEEILGLKNCRSESAKHLRNKEKVNLIHKTFIPTPTSFMQNVFQLNKFLFTSRILNEDIFYFFEDNEPFFVNAAVGSCTHIPYGILIPPVFKYGYPKISNIAKIGHIIAHEYGHDMSHYFLNDYGGYDNNTRIIFRGRSQCLIKQYSNFELKDIKKYVRGNQTIVEDLPDNLGLEVVEKISEKYITEMTKKGFSLPGMSYSPKELFYIFYAQQWCERSSPEYQLHLYEFDPHSPIEFKIKGTLQNSPQFSSVFNCSKISYMNPQKKCSVFV